MGSTLLGVLCVTTLSLITTETLAAKLPHVSFGGDTPALDDLDGLAATHTFQSTRPKGIFDDGQYRQGGEIQSIEKLRKSIPGEPDIDYPIYVEPPETSFRCNGRSEGYYADVEARCQVFRVCANTDLTGKGFAFLCPNGTLFNQQVFVCDWYKNVDCSQSENFYGKNVEMNIRIHSVPAMMAVVENMQMFPLKYMPKLSDSFGFPRPGINQGPLTGQGKPAVNAGIDRLRQPTQRPFATSNTFDGFNPNQLASEKRPQGNGNGNRLAEKTNIFEGDGEAKSVVNKTDQDDGSVNLFSRQPIYVSSLGELSTDFGDEFDVSKVKLIKPAVNTVFNTKPKVATPKPRPTGPRFFINQGQPFGTQISSNFDSTPINSGSADLLGQTLRQKQGDDGSGMNQINSGSGDLLSQSLGQAQNQNSAAALGVNAVNSGSGDLLSQSLARQQEANAGQFGANNVQSGSGNLLGQSLSGGQRAGDTFGVNQISSGSGDSLSQSLNRAQDQNKDKFGLNQINSGSGDLLSQSLQQQIPNNALGVNKVNSGSGDLLSQSLAQQQAANAGPFGVQQIESGSGDLLGQSLSQASKDKFGSQQINSGSGDLLSQSLGQRPADQFGVAQIESGSGDLLSQSLAQRQQANNNRLGANQISSGSDDLLSQSEGRRPNGDTFGVNQIKSGSGDLLAQSLSQGPQEQSGVNGIHSGSGDLLSQSLGQRPADQFGVAQIESGSGDLLSQSLAQRQQANNNGLGVNRIISGSGDLLSQSVGQRQNGDTFGVNQIQSGSGDLLAQSLGQAQRPQEQFAVNQISSGSGDLLSQSLTRVQSPNNENTFAVNQVQSGSADLLGQSVTREENPDIDHEIAISHHQSQFQTRPNPYQTPIAIKQPQNLNEVNFSSQNVNQQSQTGTSNLDQRVFTDNRSVYTQTTFSHRAKSQSSTENTQKYHYKISQTYTVDANGNIVNNIPGQPITSTINKAYIPPGTTPNPAPTPKHIFTYPEIHVNSNEIESSTVGYRQATFTKNHDNDSHVLKNRNALNLLLRGFQLSLYENELFQSFSDQLPRKNKRQDITAANTQLNKAIRNAGVDVYTYYADYPEPNEPTTDNPRHLIIDKAKMVLFNRTTFNQSDSGIFRIDLSEYDAPNLTIPIPNRNSNSNNDNKFIQRDYDHTIFDGTFLRSPTTPTPTLTTTTSTERTTTEDFPLLALPADYFMNAYAQTRKNVKRHKNAYLPTIAPIASPSSTTTFRPNSNAIPIDLQRNGKDASQQQLDEKLSLHKFSQQISASKNRAQAYVYTSIENNRPRAPYSIPPPPLQTHYPAAIQNNYASRTMVRPLEYRSTPIPASLPSIVYSPTSVRALPNYVQQTVRIPIPSSLAAASNAQYYSAPWSTRPCDLPPNRPNEKIVVKIVPANGWYLNDEKERKSYYEAVAQGLLNENGFVYVNDVQSFSSQPSQNVPIVWYSSSPSQQQSPPSPPASYYPSSRWELPQNGSPVPVLRSLQPTSTPSTQLEKHQPQPRQVSSTPSTLSDDQSNDEDGLYSGQSSYDASLKSVGKLVGDNSNATYSLASLRSSGGSTRSDRRTDRIDNNNSNNGTNIS